MPLELRSPVLEPPTFARVEQASQKTRWHMVTGKVVRVTGIIIESSGPNAAIGEICITETPNGPIQTEVVGFRDDRCLLMPLGELSGIRPGQKVTATGKVLQVPFGDDLKGRVMDGLGRPMDAFGDISCPLAASVEAQPPNPMTRTLIERPLGTGVRSIDGLLTLGEGQRIGIFAGSGVGKSTLLGMIARYCEADVNVVCLVGERGREVREFMDHELGADGLAKSVVVCATSDQPAIVRIKAAFTATAIAEAFRNQGKRVLLMMDSVTRFAMALREVGLAIGEPPSSKGYTPSVFATLPKLMERAGTAEKGSITAIYTVLVEGDDMNDPVADSARSILDGHIVLSRKLTSKGHYPPIDVLESLSRTMPMTVSKEHLAASRRFREAMATYASAEDLINLGAYKSGSNPEIDRAIELHPSLRKFLMQNKEECTSFDSCAERLLDIFPAEVTP